MKTLLCAMAIMFPVSAFAATLEWDRNSEPDMAGYAVYACFTAGCVVAHNAGMHKGATPQPAVGVKPTYTLDLDGKEGSAAISAKDKAGNESGLSVPVNFDKVAPATPVNPTLR